MGSLFLIIMSLNNIESHQFFVPATEKTTKINREEILKNLQQKLEQIVEESADQLMLALIQAQTQTAVKSSLTGKQTQLEKTEIMKLLQHKLSPQLQKAIADASEAQSKNATPFSSSIVIPTTLWLSLSAIILAQSYNLEGNRVNNVLALSIIIAVATAIYLLTMPDKEAKLRKLLENCEIKSNGSSAELLSEMQNLATILNNSNNIVQEMDEQQVRQAFKNSNNTLEKLARFLEDSKRKKTLNNDSKC
jgi:hypothetical protein